MAVDQDAADAETQVREAARKDFLSKNSKRRWLVTHFPKPDQCVCEEFDKRRWSKLKRPKGAVYPDIEDIREATGSIASP